MLDPTDPNNFSRWFTHRLAIALRFADVFTGRPIETPLNVSIPEYDWEAVCRVTDSSYRFVVTEADVPAGTLQVVVEAPDQSYVNHEPIDLSLALVPPTPPISRDDYVQEFPLWPTRKLKIPVGETAVVGRLVRTGAGRVDNLDVRMFPSGEVPPPTPFARSDSDGEFLYRLPVVTREVDGSPAPPSLEVQISEGGVPVGPVTPSSFIPEPGQVRFILFEIL